MTPPPMKARESLPHPADPAALRAHLKDRHRFSFVNRNLTEAELRRMHLQSHKYDTNDHSHN